MAYVSFAYFHTLKRRGYPLALPEERVPQGYEVWGMPDLGILKTPSTTRPKGPRQPLPKNATIVKVRRSRSNK
jgi:hypothetical protein